TVRCFSVDDRYFSWGTPVNVNVAIPANQPPAAAGRCPAEGGTGSGRGAGTGAAPEGQGRGWRRGRGGWGTCATASPARWGADVYVSQWAAPSGDKTHAVEARATDADGNVTTTATTYVKTGAGTSEPPAVLQSDRALWVWEPATYQLLENPGARQVL